MYYLSNQFFCYAFLQEITTSNVICVVTTHLKSKAKFESIRNAQVKFLLKFIDSNADFNFLYTKLNTKGLIICGDFNAEPTYSCIQYLLEFKFSSNPTLGNTKLHSAYNFLDSTKEDFLEMTTFKIRDTEYYRVIDYIFCSEGIKFLNNTPTIKKSDPTFESSGLSQKGFPNSEMPSDHYYLNLEFSF